MMRLTIYLVLILALGACQPKNRVYIKHKDLSPNIEWLKKDIREFNVPVEDISIPYNLSLSFRYAHGFQSKTAKIMLTEISPSGKQNKQEVELKIRDENGDYLGEPGYDIWDSEHLIESSKKYTEQGTYQYILEHNMPSDPLNFAMEIGVILDKVEP